MKPSVLLVLVAMVILFPLRVCSEEQVLPASDPRLADGTDSEARLARAENNLSDIPRPWTVPKMIGIFKRESEAWPRRIVLLPKQTDTDTEKMTLEWRRSLRRCRDLALVLAASRDPRAVVALGDMLDAEYPDKNGVIVALFDYFVHDMFYGLPPEEKAKGQQSLNGLDYIIPATTRWWNDNKARLRKEAALAKDQ